MYIYTRSRGYRAVSTDSLKTVRTWRFNDWKMMAADAEDVLSEVHVTVRPTLSSNSGSLTRFRISFPFSQIQKDQKERQTGDVEDQEINDCDEKRSTPYTGNQGQGQAADLITDEDGDIIVTRNAQAQEDDTSVVTIEHAMETSLSNVGLQVWQGCLMLCDFILHNWQQFSDCKALELGGGTGLASIVMATIARLVICTDTGQDILDMCQRNIQANTRLYSRRASYSDTAEKNILVKNLDWSASELDTDEHNAFHWTEEDVQHLQDIDVIIAADVIYSNSLTDAFFQQLLQLLMLGKPKTCFISLEKRLNFTLTDLDVTCKEYDHFRDWLETLQTEQGLIVTQLSTLDLPQYIKSSPRSKYLELWKISGKPSSCKS